MTPTLTVLMAVRNGMPYLPLAVESILSQTFREFRFLIVDDASTDETREALRSYRDSRIEVLSLERNVGQTAALNLGFRRAATPWIARMDADDFSAPQRLELQMRAFAEDPSLACVGTAIWEFTSDPGVRRCVHKRPAGSDQIRRAALFGSAMFHGTVVVSREAVLEAGGYDERYRYASDRDLFFRLLRRHRAVNLSEPLVGLRKHGAQDSYSLKAADEYIAVFLRQLENSRYAPEERRILRGSLAYSHLFRARCLARSGAIVSWGRDQVRALQLSPVTWGRHWAGALAATALPERACQSLRGEFWRQVP